MMNYKIEQLEKMLEAEEKPDGGYGAHLAHWAGTAKAIQLDAQALQALIWHYKERIAAEERTEAHKEIIKSLKRDGEASYKGHSFIFDDVTNDVEVQHEGQYFVTLSAQWELEEFLEGLEENEDA